MKHELCVYDILDDPINSSLDSVLLILILESNIESQEELTHT